MIYRMRIARMATAKPPKQGKYVSNNPLEWAFKELKDNVESPPDKEKQQEMLAKADFNLKSARISLQEDFPFFYDILFFMNFKPIFNRRVIPTMGINARGEVFYNPEFVLSLSKKKLMGTLIHEAIHQGWLHVLRGTTKQNHGIWNLAIDCHANQMAVSQKLELPDEIACVPTYNDSVEIRLETPQGRWVYTVEEVSQKTSEQIYEELLKAGVPEPPKGSSKKGKGNKSGQGNGSPGDDGDNDGDGDGGQGDEYTLNGGLDKHDFTGDGRQLTPEEASREEEKWKQITINAAERAKQMGKLPAGFERFIDKLLQPKVDWKNLLYNSVISAIPSGDRTWRRRDRRYAAWDMYMPDYRKEGIDLTAWIDTSGSISDKNMTEFVSELAGIISQFDAVSMNVGFVDAEVYPESILSIQDASVADLARLRPKGGGGTDMCVAIDYTTEHMKGVETLVILTDGYTPFPKQAPHGINLIWVICPGGIKEKPGDAPGMFIFMTEDN